MLVQTYSINLLLLRIEFMVNKDTSRTIHVLTGLKRINFNFSRLPFILTNALKSSNYKFHSIRAHFFLINYLIKY